MPSSKVRIIDYGLCNLLSVRRAFELFSSDVKIVQHPRELAEGTHVVLPGVGAFGDGIKGLRDLGFSEAILKIHESGRPFMGICLGMQLMMESSEEFGFHEGLALIEGKVLNIPKVGPDGTPNRVPHVGWSKTLCADIGWQDTPLQNTESGSYFYFVHSYSAVPTNRKNILAEATYNQNKITAAVRNENSFGFQFHPEKSGPHGLEIVKQFLNS